MIVRDTTLASYDYSYALVPFIESVTGGKLKKGKNNIMSLYNTQTSIIRHNDTKHRRYIIYVYYQSTYVLN